MQVIGSLHIIIQACCGRINGLLGKDVPNCDRECWARWSLKVPSNINQFMTVNTASIGTQETPKNPVNTNQEKNTKTQEVTTADFVASCIEVAVSMVQAQLLQNCSAHCRAPLHCCCSSHVDSSGRHSPGWPLQPCPSCQGWGQEASATIMSLCSSHKDLALLADDLSNLPLLVNPSQDHCYIDLYIDLRAAFIVDMSLERQKSVFRFYLISFNEATKLSPYLYRAWHVLREEHLPQCLL